MNSLLFSTLITLWIQMSSQANNLNYENVKKMIESQDIRRLEDFLDLLPTEVRSTPILIHSSRSLQGASPLAPRVILHEGPKFMMAFNGDKNQKGYSGLEMMEYNFAKSRFEFNEIVFFEKENLKPQFNPQPAKCLTCHGTDPRPNWDIYDRWPDMYGQYKGRYEAFTAKEADLIAQIPRVGRYKYIPQIEPEQRRVFQPLIEFGAFLSALNRGRILRIINESPELRPYRYALMAAFYLGSYVEEDSSYGVHGYIGSYLTSNAKLKLNRDINDLMNDTFRRRGHYARSVLKRCKKELDCSLGWYNYDPNADDYSNGRALGDMYYGDRIAKVRYIVEGLGISMRDWSMTFERSYLFNDGYDSISRMAIELAELYDPEIALMMNRAKDYSFRVTRSRIDKKIPVLKLLQERSLATLKAEL